MEVLLPAGQEFFLLRGEWTPFEMPSTFSQSNLFNPGSVLGSSKLSEQRASWCIHRVCFQNPLNRPSANKVYEGLNSYCNTLKDADKLPLFHPISLTSIQKIKLSFARVKYLHNNNN